jgi:hypothetical protein
VIVPWTDLHVLRRALLSAGPYNVCIADEVHLSKAGHAKIAQALYGDSSPYTPYRRIKGSGLLSCIDTGGFWPMSATLCPNGRPVEILNILHAVGHPIATDPDAYIRRYCHNPNRWVPKGWDDKGAINLAELNKALNPYLVRFHRGNIPPGDLPPLQRQLVPLEGFDANTRAIIQDLAANLVERRIEALQVRAILEGKPEPDPAELEAARTLSGGRGNLPPFELLSAYRAAIQPYKITPAAAWIVDHYKTHGNLQDYQCAFAVAFHLQLRADVSRSQPDTPQPDAFRGSILKPNAIVFHGDHQAVFLVDKLNIRLLRTGVFVHVGDQLVDDAIDHQLRDRLKPDHNTGAVKVDGDPFIQPEFGYPLGHHVHQRELFKIHGHQIVADGADVFNNGIDFLLHG